MGTIYRFGEFTLDPGHRTLLRHGQTLSITPKCFETLAFLVKNRGQLIAKRHLMDTLWPESFVEEANLKQNIYVLRRLLGDDSNGNSLIATVPRQGYRFIGSVTEAEITESSAAGNGNGADPSSATIQYWAQNSPFRGLQVFEPEDAWLFFGRESETEALVERLGRSRVLVVTGNSGCGKSSLVRAGLVPALRYGGSSESWRTVLFRPSANPFDYLAEVLPGQLQPGWSPQQQVEFTAGSRSKFASDRSALRNAVTSLLSLEAHRRGSNGNGASADDNPGTPRVLLVADQFEEIFTLVSDQRLRNQYIDMLLEASQCDRSLSVSLVLILRADFYSRCLDHPGLSRCLETNLFNVPRLAGEKLRENIEKRLELAGACAEAGLIDRLLEDVGSEPGNLALLEHALDQLWSICGGFGHTLTNHAYAAIGGLRGALGRHADHVYESLDAPELKTLVERIFLALVHLGDGADLADVNDTRRRVSKTELLSFGPPVLIEQLITLLVTARLISTGREGEETFVEVSHEALIREWPRLREWLTENRDRLRLERRLHQAAQEWESMQHDPGALLQGAHLAQAEEWLSGQRRTSPLLHTFLQSSLDARADRERKEQESLQREFEHQKSLARLARRSAIRLRWFSSILTVLLLLALGASWFARKQRVLAEARTLAAQSEQMLTHDQGRALDLALRGWARAKTPETYTAVITAFPQTVSTLRHDGEILTALFSPDGKRILTTSGDYTARIWNGGDGSLLAVLRGHSDMIGDGAFSPDGQRVVTASLDHTARIWNTADGRLLATLTGHRDKVVRAAFSPDGQRVLTASLDHTARVWNAVNGRMLMTLSGHTRKVLNSSFSPDGHYIATASVDGTARVWSANDGHCVAILRGHRSFRFSADSRRIVTVGADSAARVWDVASGRLSLTLPYENMVQRAAFSSDGQRIVTTGRDNTARIWNAYDGHLLTVLRHESPPNDAEFSPDNQHVVTASDNSARVWNVADGRLLGILQGHTGTVWEASFSPSGRFVITTSSDHTSRIWNMAGGRLLFTLHGEYAALSADGKRVVTGGQDSTARLWSMADGHLIGLLKGHSDAVYITIFSPDDQRVLTASWDHTARVWSATDRRPLVFLEGHKDKIWKAMFSPDGQSIVSASADHTARLWRTSDGHLLAVLQGHTQGVLDAVFSPDGQRIVTTSADHTARVWRTSDGHLLDVLEGHTDRVKDAAFSPNGQLIVTASADHTARVWSTLDGRLLSVLKGHTDGVSEAAFSPDGQLIVTASADHTARIWKAVDGSLIAILEGHTSMLFSATFSPNSQQVATASNDGTAKVWNTADGSLITTLEGHGYPVFLALFSRDGKHVITTGSDDLVRIWQVLTVDDVQSLLAK